MEEEGYSSLPTSHLLGSVPAVIPEGKKPAHSEASASNLNVFPPPGSGNPPELSDKSGTDWKGFFTVSSYSPFFNVDSDIVLDRLISSIDPRNNSFFRKIDSNPDLYGPTWIAATLVFTLSAFGNSATYLMQKKTDPNISWNFDVGYVNWAASIIYGYLILVPLAYYFLLQYFGSQPSLVRFWCMWGYSLFVFIPTSVLMVVPFELFRWIMIMIAGGASSWFVSSNLKAYVEGTEMMALVVSALLLHFTLALFIKVFFFA
ncbi:hypothetical protein LUZ60_010874 [Juncus effusus]|nr:hypothetical protein LUZ60_010874 [Juncus effusus]